MGSRLEQKSTLVRKRIENHTFEDEEGDEYGASSFGGFPEYFRRKKIKLQNKDHELRAQSGDKPQIFKGIVCHVNGYTQPSLNDLHVLIVQHGGGFIQYLDGKTMVTHIIASQLTPKKKEEFKRYRIVKPAWIVDSVNAGKLQPWDAYRVVDEGVGQKVLGFQNGTITTQSNRKPQTYKEQTDTSWYTSQLRARNTASASITPESPNQTQIVTPADDIRDDHPLPEITSSIERALADADTDQELESDTPRDGHAPETVHIEDKHANDIPQPTSSPHAPDRNDQISASHHPSKAPSGDEVTELRPREGSQEPDYAMAVIRDSDVFRNISPSRLASMTAEEHNALLLSDPRIRKSTVVHPDFLEQYYRESRLHHLSTWKADLKSQMQALAAQKALSQKHKLKKLPGQRRYILHVDFDSFFAAVSLKKYPQYKDKPAVVAHGGGSGSEIASCNYPARKYGITNGMWMRRAQDLCPEVKILPYDFPAYEEASRKFYDAILATGGIVQSVSIDEALVDVSALCFAESGTDGVRRNEGAVHHEQRKADMIAQELRDQVLRDTGCAVSVGIGGNILQAKLALRKAKPAGQYQLKPEEVLDFIGNFEVQNLPGVAWSIGGKLEEIGVRFVKDIRELTKERLISTLGPKTGEKLWDYARGIDKSEVGDQVVRKSVSAEVNWGVRFENLEQVDEFMHGLCGELHKRLMKERVKGRQLTMKVMRRAHDAPRDPPKHLGHGKCDTYNKSLQLGVATNDAALITREAIAMIRSFGITPGELRGIGVQMQKLELIKTDGENADLGSQRRLHFKSAQSLKHPAPPEVQSEKMQEDPIQDDERTLEERNTPPETQTSVGVRGASASTPTKRPLNTLGTQFVLPTQADASVLAELPDDIRSRLTKHLSSSAPSAPERQADIEEPTKSRPPSRDQSPAVRLPNASQIDPDILEALPEDVRAEVLGYYKSPGNSKRAEQAVLPQSPRKNRTAPASKQPVKRKRGGGLFPGRSRSNLNKVGDSSTLTQANFVSRPAVKHLHEEGGATTTDTEAEPDAVDPEVLAALPEDVRREVLQEQRNARLARAGGIDLTLHQRSRVLKRKTKRGSDDEGPLDRMLVLAPRLPSPTFTIRKLSKLSELRDAVKAWFGEFADEGPYEEDVEALVTYLRHTVMEARDMGKAVAVVEWMSWLLENATGMRDEVQAVWIKALNKMRDTVRRAVRERGLGEICFGR